MKKLLVIGTSVISDEMISYAKRKGVYTIVVDNRPPEVSTSKLISDEAWDIDLFDIDAIEKRCREENITAIISGVSEFRLEICMELCERLGLPCYLTKQAWHYSVDKEDFKKVCKQVGAPVAKDYYVSDVLSDEELDAIEYPVVVKPVDLMGNVGISYCNNKQELRQAYKLAKSLTHQKNKIVIEKMLHGAEWYSTYAIQDGEIRLLSLNAMCAQPGELKNLYSITTTITDHVPRFVKEINHKIEAVLKAVGCKQGIAWVQVMLDEDDHFYIIEMGYRFPGDMTFIPYPKMLGFDSVKWMVDIALGEELSIDLLPKSQERSFEKCGCGYSLWVNHGGVITQVKGLDQLLSDPRITYYSAHKVGSSVDYHRTIGVFSFTTDSIDEFCELIDKINKTLIIENEKGEDMIIRYTDFDYLKTQYYKGLKEN